MKCGCGHDVEDVLELSSCARCGQKICLKCAYIEPKTCKMYCSKCALEKFGVKVPSEHEVRQKQKKG